MKPLKSFLYRIKNFLVLCFDFKEHFVLAQMKKDGRILNMESMKDIYKDKDFFCFGTGGSLSNLKNFERVKNKNSLFITTGPIFCYREFGFLPDMWIITNPPSMEKFIKELEKEKSHIDFSKMLIFVPENFSRSKEVNISSKVMKKFRKLINNNARFVLYKKNWNTGKKTKNYLSKQYPLASVRGSAVEGTFLVFLNYLGVKNIYFSGVDMMDTGHFWNRNEAYQDINGNKLNFQEIKSNEEVFEAGKIARAQCQEHGINIFRLEKIETILTDYDYIDFDKAIELSTDKHLI